MRTFIKNSIAVASAIAVIQNASGAQAIWTQYTSNQDKHANLPNCSYAGYHNGNTALPNPTTNIINVKTAHGAKGDGTSDDTAAIRNAINAVGTSGGVVFFPNGTYVVSGVLFIHKNNTILRGESRTGVTLRFTKSLNTGYATNANSSGQSRWSWAGGMIWFTPQSKNTYLSSMPGTISSFSESWNVGSQITTVSSQQVRGDKSFTVASTTGLSANQFVFIRLVNATDLSTLKHLCGGGTWANGYDWSTANSGGVLPASKPNLDWIVQIASISGNTVTLKQPLRFDLRTAWSPKIMAVGNTIRECGMENITVRFNRDYDWVFNTHHNKEPGWNGPWFNNAIDCFVRGVTVVDPDSGMGVSASKNVTFTDVKLEWSSTANRRDHHHGTTCRTFSQDCLFENFTVTSEPWHGLNVEDFSAGNVWSKGNMSFGTFDTHRALPYENIRTEITISNTGNRGGAGNAGPVMGARFVCWNINVTNNRNNMIGSAEEMPKGAIVGVRGCTINNPVHPTYGNSECVIDATGATPDPINVYVAQKSLRLGGGGTTNPSPTVSITSPANGATFTAPASIAINANAADTSPGTVSNVQFFAGSTSLGTDSSSPYGITWNSVAAGAYSLSARATDNGGAVSTSSAVNVTVNGTTSSSGGGTPGTGTGLKGEYFDNVDFTSLKTTRTDSTVNFSWGTAIPAGTTLTSADTYSVRWTGEVQPMHSQTYTFYTRTDDGVRLWVNNVLLIDKWVNQAATEWSGTITLTANTKYAIKMEYLESTGDATAQLSWSSASQAKQIIPQSQLYPATSSGGGTSLFKINCGGAAVSPFTADANFSGGTAASTTATIDLSGVTSPAPAAVYQTERYGNVTYTFGSLTAGAAHTVRLHFAETWHNGAGLRKFDVSINGTQVLNDYDVYAAAGAKNKAVVSQHTANANASGQIVIQFTNVVDNAKISGIEIIKN